VLYGCRKFYCRGRSVPPTRPWRPGYALGLPPRSRWVPHTALGPAATARVPWIPRSPAGGAPGGVSLLAHIAHNDRGASWDLARMSDRRCTPPPRRPAHSDRSRAAGRWGVADRAAPRRGRCAGRRERERRSGGRDLGKAEAAGGQGGHLSPGAETLPPYAHFFWRCFRRTGAGDKVSGDPGALNAAGRFLLYGLWHSLCSASCPPPPPDPDLGCTELTVADRPVLCAGAQQHPHGALVLLMFKEKSARRSPSVRELRRGPEVDGKTSMQVPLPSVEGTI
jgi:hypothetical protein